MKIFTGKVIATRDTTASVLVDRVIVHPLYKKRFRRNKKYLVQDDLGVKVGDAVKFADSMPFSKMKKWRILEVVGEKKKGAKK